MEETKKTLNSKSIEAGNVEKEIFEIRKMKQENVEDIFTITVGCSELYTLICC